MNNTYYVYIHIDPVTNLVRYVGKGTGNRAYSMFGRSAYHKKWIDRLTKQGLSFTVEIIEKELPEQQALELEVLWIAAYRHAGMPLTNLTNGGEGISGYRHSAESRAKIAVASASKRYTEESKQKMSRSQLGKTHTDESKKLISQKQKEFCKNNGNQFVLGLSKGKHTEATKKQISIAGIGREVSNTTREQIKVHTKMYAIQCMETGIIYSSAKTASKQLNFNNPNAISKVCRGLSKAYKGFTFRYLDRPLYKKPTDL